MVNAVPMGFWSGLFQRNNISWNNPRDRSLVDEPKGRQAGKRAAVEPVELTPWSATRLTSIFRNVQGEANGRAVDEARRARRCLSQFWLHAPVDQLQGLYRTPIGQSYRVMLKVGLAEMPLLTEEQEWRDGLVQKLSRTMNRPEAVNLILAAMPYFARGKMRLMNATDVIPQWLMGDYSALFDPGLARLLRRPVGLLGPAGTAAQRQRGGIAPQSLPLQPQRQRETVQANPPRNAGQLPLMADRRGNEALALIQNKEFIGRMNGLINLYTIDPGDAEVKRELTALRRQMGQIWLDLNPQQLQALYQSGFGQMYRNFLGSGFSREPLAEDDQALRSKLVPFVSNMSQPKAVNALLAALPFFKPGRIQFGGGERFIPGWLLQDIQTINGQSLPA